MILYDVIHLEDEEDITWAIGRRAKSHGFSYASYSNLSDFEESLRSAKMAKVYLIDGNVPYSGESTSSGFILEETIKMLMKYVIKDQVKIAVVSANPTLCRPIAKEYGLNYFEKPFETDELIEYINSSIGQE